MKTTTKRATRSLAASLAIVLALATGGAWAVSTTYRQSLGVAEGANILFDGILTASDEITYEPKLAFAGITLDAIPERASFFTTSYGSYITHDGAICVGMHETRHYDDEGKCDKLAVQCAVYDIDLTKCVLILLTNGAAGDGVYVQKVAQYYVDGAWLHSKYYAMDESGNLSAAGGPKGWSTTDNGYQLAGLRISGASPTASGKADVLAFPGKTLADIKDCNFEAFYRIGRYMSIPATNNVARYITAWPSSSDPQKLVMQFEHPNGFEIKKTAVIQMTNGVYKGESAVYAFQSIHTWEGDDNIQRFAVNAETGAVTASNLGGSSSATSNDPPEYPVHGLIVLPPCVKKTPTKVWADKTLDDIKDGTFTARMCGAWVSRSFHETPDSAVGCNKKVCKDDGGSVTNILVEFQVRDGSYIKCLVVSFENGAGGVYASAVNARFAQGEALGYVFRDYDGTLHGAANASTSEAFAETPTADGYGVFDLNVTVEVEEATEWVLDQDRTWSELKGGETLASDEVVRIKVTGESPTLTINENVEVAKIEFVNALASGISTNSVAVSDGVTVTYGTLALGQNARVAVPGSFVPSAVSLDSGSTLVYASGETVAATYSGLGAVEVAPGVTLFIDSDVTVPYILNNGTVVKRGAGTVLMPFHNDSTGVTTVSSGTLKVASVAGSGTNHTVRVKSGATFDVNGCIYLNVNIVLENGSHFANASTTDVQWGDSQAVSLALDGDATATATKNFGLVAPNHGKTTLGLDTHTFTIGGEGNFIMANTMVAGTGKVVANCNTLVFYKGACGDEWSLEIGEGKNMWLYNGGKANGSGDRCDVTVSNFWNKGTITASQTTGTLTVKGVLTTGNAIPDLALADGATVKATGTAQVVSTTFSASGTYTIDASEITREQLNAAVDNRIPVLTVPTTNAGGSWAVANPPLAGVCAKWVDNKDGTSTLCLCKPVGFIVIVK